MSMHVHVQSLLIDSQSSLQHIASLAKEGAETNFVSGDHFSYQISTRAWVLILSIFVFRRGTAVVTSSSSNTNNRTPHTPTVPDVKHNFLEQVRHQPVTVQNQCLLLRRQALQRQASPGDPVSSRPTRVPPRFGRGSTRGPPSSNNNIGRTEFDSSSTTSGGLGGAWRTGGTSSSSPTSPGIHAAISDTVVDDFRGSGKAPLQERLQAAPTFLREKAVDLREDARDRVQDIRVSARNSVCLVWWKFMQATKYVQGA